MNWRAWLREYLQFCRESPVFLFLVVVIVPAAIVIWCFLIRLALQMPTTGFSMADAFVLTASPLGGGSALGMVVAPLSALFTLLLGNRDFAANRLLRVGSKKLLWMKKVFMSVLTAASLSVYAVLIVSIIGGVTGTEPVNFSQVRSLFYMSTHGAVIPDPSIAVVLLVFAAYCFLMLLAMNILATLLNWFYPRIWLSVLLVVTCGFLDFLPQEIPTLYSVVSMGYDNWLRGDFFNIIFCLTGIVLVVLIGRELVDRKDFPRAH